MAQRLFDFDGTFFRGAKSDSDPGQLPLGCFWMSINMINVGGLLSCRPGYRCIVALPSGHLQGMSIYRPKVGLEQALVCIDGVLHVSDWPFQNFRMVDNVLFSPDAKQIFWCAAEQSAQRLSSDINSAIEVINPRSLLLIQDGGFSAPAYYDGTSATQMRNDPFATPSGGPMAWVGDRLWVARGSYVYAGDIANPLSFRELIYLGGVGALTYPQDVTALAKTPGLDSPQLLVFTAENCSIVQANIRDRSLWQTTTDFSKEILSVGATGQRGVVNHFGNLAWMSQVGFHLFDSAIQTRHEARIALRDNEMLASKSVLFDDLSLCAGGAWGQFLVMSVPAEDLFNKHTWVLNDASLETLQDDSGPSWCGYWIGTRPVEWACGLIGGAERAYHVSADEDGVNRLWEAFLPDRRDNGCPITWAVESRGYFGMTSQAQKLPGSDCRFAYADIALVGVEEDLDIAAFYAGGLRGAYKKIMSKRYSVQRGSLVSGQNVTATTSVFALKPQTRQARTEDARLMDAGADSGSCPAEAEKLEDYDESFQMLIVGQGPAAIRWVRAFAEPRPEDQSGDGRAKTNEAGVNAIRYDGSGVTALDVGAALAEVAALPLDYYESSQSVSLTQSGISVVGVGHATSVISQGAADRVATVNATQQAEALLKNLLPPIWSAAP